MLVPVLKNFVVYHTRGLFSSTAVRGKSLVLTRWKNTKYQQKLKYRLLGNYG